MSDRATTGNCVHTHRHTQCRGLMHGSCIVLYNSMCLQGSPLFTPWRVVPPQDHRAWAEMRGCLRWHNYPWLLSECDSNYLFHQLTCLQSVSWTPAHYKLNHQPSHVLLLFFLPESVKGSIHVFLALCLKPAFRGRKF